MNKFIERRDRVNEILSEADDLLTYVRYRINNQHSIPLWLDLATKDLKNLFYQMSIKVTLSLVEAENALKEREGK